MAFNDPIKMSIIDTATGYYYSAYQSTTGVWTVTSDPAIDYISSLPQGWDETTISWERHSKYMGMFRSRSDGSYKYSGDARAVLNYLRQTKGIQADATLLIWQCMDLPSTPTSNDAFRYEIAYKSQFDFKTYKDSLQNKVTEISTLDSQLFRLLQAYGGTKYNIPFWYSTDGGITFTLDPDAIAIRHNGIKLRYNATFTSSATDTNPLEYSDPLGTELKGWNHGAQGDGFHSIPSMSQYNIVQNNGTTTYIGNDILQPFILTGNQCFNAAGLVENTFEEVNHSQPFTRDNYSIKDLLNNPDASGNPLEINVAVSMTASFGPPQPPLGQNYDFSFPSPTGRYMAFVLFEIDNTNKPPIVSSRYTYKCELFRHNFPSTGLADFIPDINTSNAPVQTTLEYNKVYVVGLITDDDSFTSSPRGFFKLHNFTFSVQSLFDSGASGVPINAPFFPQSSFLAYRLDSVFKKIVPYLDTTRADDYGFPIPVTSDITAVSNFLSDPDLTPIYDAIPYNVALASSYCIHDLQGRSYISMSLNDLFDFCNKVFQCGMSIEPDTNGDQNIMRIENLTYYFDPTVMLMNLGTDIYGLEITQLTDGLGCNLKAGYTKADTNTDFGVDPFNTELYYNTPLSTLSGTMDYEETVINTEMYAIEKIRQQQVSQPIGAGYDPANPSSDNEPVAIYITPTTHGTAYIANPNNQLEPYSAYIPQVYPTAQNSDPSATIAPYVHGLYYPDTAINIPLSPCRNLKRAGGYLHSVLDLMDSEYLTFRNTAVMQYNNQPLALTGIESNLQVGAGASPITEFKDIKIGDLDPQLFKPIIISFTCRQPINMWKIMNTNTNGFIQIAQIQEDFTTKIYRGFLWKVKQNIGNNSATEFQLLACPDMVI